MPANTVLLIVVILVVIVILYFVISRNQKDKKELESGGMEDVMEETITDQERKNDQL